MTNTSSRSKAPYSVRQFTPAHPDLKNGAGVPASLASEHYVEALARVVSCRMAAIIRRR